MSTTRWAVLLRGVNVGGYRRVPMAMWRARLEALGHTDVTTHLQSGQAVLTARTEDAAALCAQVRADLLSGLGVDTVVMARTGAQLQAVVDGCPWPDVGAEHPTTVHAVLVDAAPTGWVVNDADRYAPELARVGAGVVYQLTPGGLGRSRLPPVADGTARNWRTVLALRELTAQPDGTPG